MIVDYLLTTKLFKIISHTSININNYYFIQENQFLTIPIYFYLQQELKTHARTLVERAPSSGARESVATSHREQTQNHTRHVPRLRREGKATTTRSTTQKKTVKNQQKRQMQLSERK